MGNCSLLNMIDFENITYFLRSSDQTEKSWDEVPDDIKNTFDRLGIPEAEQKWLGGVTAQYESEAVYHSIREDLEEQGVIFLDMDSGLKQFPEIVKEYFDKWFNLEGEMFFLQREVILRDLQINELNMSVSDMKGKFIKPTLKKVSKYENKFAKLQEKAAKFAFANQLKAKDK